MASPPSATPSGRYNPFSVLVENARKHKQSFLHFFVMTGILMLSCRSLAQKYRIHTLSEDAAALKEEHEKLTTRKNSIKQSLLHEAALEPTGAFAARLRHLFGDDN